jgi:hypothetical protein
VNCYTTPCFIAIHSLAVDPANFVVNNISHSAGRDLQVLLGDGAIVVSLARNQCNWTSLDECSRRSDSRYALL